ncbi:MAG: GxxExxY protein [Candidatus Aureabacteria bacterium]|nr:GxxExxY protein [Candidatus Auribacterota bacterium]
MTDYLYSDVTDKIIKCAYRVHNTLGFGFLEKVYENALAIELRAYGLAVEQQKPLTVRYRGEVVGEFLIDLLLEGKIIVEIKAVRQLIDIHEIQVLNYLKGCGLEVGLLINFSQSLEVKRKYFKSAARSEKSE